MLSETAALSIAMIQSLVYCKISLESTGILPEQGARDFSSSNFTVTQHGELGIT